MNRQRRAFNGCGFRHRKAAQPDVRSMLPSDTFSFKLSSTAAADPFKAGDTLFVSPEESPVPGGWVVVQRLDGELTPVEYEPGITLNVVGVLVMRGSLVGLYRSSNGQVAEGGATA